MFPFNPKNLYFYIFVKQKKIKMKKNCKFLCVTRYGFFFSEKYILWTNLCKAKGIEEECVISLIDDSRFVNQLTKSGLFKNDVMRLTRPGCDIIFVSTSAKF